MKVYLDNCTFNRPFDDQSVIRNRLEAEAKLFIQAEIKAGNLELLWSYIIDFENSENPFNHRRESIETWREEARINLSETASLLNRARDLELKYRLAPKDALHLASAMSGGADCFITTDDSIKKNMRHFRGVRVLSPLEFVSQYGGAK